ncbi:MAG: hypothetical protein ACLQU1_20730 [Bryobacteraceae bacterium]
MNMAEGSLEESRYYLILAQDLGYGDTRVVRSKKHHIPRSETELGPARVAGC